MTGRRWAAVAVGVLAVAYFPAYVLLVARGNTLPPIIFVTVPLAFIANWLWKTGEGGEA